MLGLTFQVIFSLLVVFGLMWAMAKMAKRPLRSRGVGALTVLTRAQLSRSASVAVVKVLDQALIIGVTDNQVTLLGEADLAALTADTAPAEQREQIPLTTVIPVARIGGDELPRLNGHDPLNGLVNGHHGGAAMTNGNGDTALAGPLAGSVLSPGTWRQAVSVLRERTVRR
ncbi:flagellar biosynthetic protein FliO [Pilimelia columellifera]|uniref:Flagellar protein n=1 Tax=Pilimelia columellifera subsp. columellifera TaxID=706583 RepID=A0ABN3N864_9ACTN